MARDVKAALSRGAMRAFRFKVYEDDIEMEGGRFFVPFESKRRDVSVFEYAARLNKIEDAFEEKGIKVMLVPAIAFRK